MPEEPKVTPKADVDTEVFEPIIRRLRERAKEEAEARTKNNQTQWLMPEMENWDGNLFNIEGLSDPFKRDKLGEMFDDATKDGDDSGAVGDLQAITLQTDWLACMERAFRARHTMRRPRAMAHMTGRRRGHGNDRGVLTQCVLEYVRNVVKSTQA